MDSNNDIILFSSDSFYQYANQLLQDYPFLPFSTFEEFFKKTIKRKFNRPFKLNSQSIVTDFYELKTKPISAFWIVEQTPQHVASIRNILIKLRWMGFKQPVIVSSFRDLPDLAPLPPYKLPGLFSDFPLSEKFIRLPVHTTEFRKALSELVHLDYSLSKIGYLKANTSLLDHDLCKYPYSKK